jgi:hypothetical protein
MAKTAFEEFAVTSPPHPAASSSAGASSNEPIL